MRGAGRADYGLHIDRLDQARLAQRAENEYVGAPTGLLDQLSSLFGEESTALLIDFRELTVSPVGFDPSASGVVLLLIDSRERHGHVGGEYAARRLSCERAAADVGVVSLREIQDRGVAVLDGVKDPVDARRARHVLTENQRVFDFVAALGDSDYASAGRIFTASHASMRDDFAITTPHIDLIADTAVNAGALGARMTGGGFGGCVIALVPADRVEAVGDGRALSGARRGLRRAGDHSDACGRRRICHMSTRGRGARCAHLRATTRPAPDSFRSEAGTSAHGSVMLQE